ncbi:MAG: hypothetical protein K6F05_02935 [Succinivibrio sp.]|nr:hypothetical protein [Succinivibrio sp.]
MFKFRSQLGVLRDIRHATDLVKYCSREQLELDYPKLGQRIYALCPRLKLLERITALLPLEDELTFNFMLHALNAPLEFISEAGHYRINFYAAHRQVLNQQARETLSEGRLSARGDLMIYQGAVSCSCDTSHGDEAIAGFITELFILETLRKLGELKLAELMPSSAHSEQSQPKNEPLALAALS